MMRITLLLIVILLAIISPTGCMPVPLKDSRQLLNQFRLERLHDWKAIDNQQQRRLAQERWDVVVQFAPFIRQELCKNCSEEQERSDFILSFTYDGNERTADNEDNLNLRDKAGYKYDLNATVYYSIVETHTHRFITYFLYHAVDWDPLPNILWLGISHENDGENLQIVTRKASAGEPERIILLATQAHHTTQFFAAPDSNIRSDNWTLQPAPIRLGQMRQFGGGASPIVRVESGGHGIYGDLSTSDDSIDSSEYISFIPSDRTERGDSWVPGGKSYEYRLVPIHDTLWQHYVKNTSLGDGGILDGSFDYEGELAVYRNVPRFFDSDRLSYFLMWKKDSGIVPFVLDGNLLDSRKGRLFFDPANTYRQQFGVSGNWSTEYTYNPYIPGGPPPDVEPSDIRVIHKNYPPPTPENHWPLCSGNTKHIKAIEGLQFEPYRP